MIGICMHTCRFTTSRARDLTLQLIDELLVEAEVRGWRVKESRYAEVNRIDLDMDMEF
jgi:hypothetical protein